MADIDLESRISKALMRWYPAIRHRTAPITRLAVPLERARVALITSCGVHLASDRPFDLADRRGDPSFRAIPAAVDPADLAITHPHYNHAPALQDINVVLPLARLQELADEGRIGSVAAMHYSCMGAIGFPGRLIRQTAPAIARQLKADAVDVVLLTPC